jgi:excisionase family DNA binding protein
MSDRTPLYVRLPSQLAENLDRAAFELRTSKQDLVAEAVRRITIEGGDTGLTLGHAEVHADAPADVLTVDGAAALLQASADDVRALAESGELPGRKVGGDWRFARAAILRWLARAD